MNNYFKGQQALEYLVTYGWAILIIAVAIALIVYFIVVPSFAAPPTCIMSGPLHCADIIVSSNPSNTIVTVFLLNQQQYPVNNAQFFVNLNGTNSSSVACVPSFVKPGANTICMLTLNSVSSQNQRFKGSLYVKSGNCALLPSFTVTGNCIGAPNQTFSGSFTTQSGGSTTFTTTASVATTTFVTTTINSIGTTTLTQSLLVAGVSANPASFTLAGTGTVSSSASGGTPPYSYQWYEQAPGGNWVAVGTSSSQTLTTTRWSTLGQYNFILQVTDHVGAMANSPTGSISVQVPSLPISLNNTATSATPTTFQQILVVPASTYSANIDATFNNIEFSTSPNLGGTILNAWIENNPTNTSTATGIWVQLTSAIASGNIAHIYMNFLPYSVLSRAGPTGEAPQLTLPGNYAQYDDGWKVFSFYDDFPLFPNGVPPAFTSINTTNWVWTQSFGSNTVNNGITLTATGKAAYAALLQRNTATPPVIAEANIISTNPTAGYSSIVEEDNSVTDASPTAGFFLATNPCTGQTNSFTDTVGSAFIGTFGCGAGNWRAPQVTGGVFGLAWVNGSVCCQSYGQNIDAVVNDGLSSTIETNTVVGGWNDAPDYTPTAIVMKVGQINCGSTCSGTGSTVVQWVRERAYPPNSIMPTVQFNK